MFCCWWQLGGERPGGPGRPPSVVDFIGGHSPRTGGGGPSASGCRYTVLGGRRRDCARPWRPRPRAGPSAPEVTQPWSAGVSIAKEGGSVRGWWESSRDGGPRSWSDGVSSGIGFGWRPRPRVEGGPVRTCGRDSMGGALAGALSWWRYQVGGLFMLSCRRLCRWRHHAVAIGDTDCEYCCGCKLARTDLIGRARAHWRLQEVLTASYGGRVRGWYCNIMLRAAAVRGSLRAEYR